MPVEHRTIHFSENEVKIALMQFSARKDLKFTVDNIQDFKLKGGEKIEIALKVFDAAKNDTGVVKYGHSEVAAALMGYCMFLKIPLPKISKKALKSNDQGLYLRIKTER